MLNRFLTASLLCVLAFTVSKLHAAVTLTLSSPSNLTTLAVGQDVEIDVTLSGLPAPNNQTDFIFNLNTKTLFPSVFTPIANPASSSGLTATTATGSVFNDPVQGALQVANFDAQSSLTSSSAIGNFSQSPNASSGAIGLNGLYYSFLLKAVSSGTGSIQLDPAPGANQYAANETGFNFAPLPSNGALAVNVSSVPEPSTLTLLGVGLLVTIAGHRLQPLGR